MNSTTVVGHSALPGHFSHQDLHCDILVAGGGAAGWPCALVAARQGAKVILCHDRPVLGGNASSEIRMHIVGANMGRNGRDLELETRESGIIEEIRLENAVRNPQRSPSMFDFILYEKCRAEPNLTLLLNTSVTTATVSDAGEDGRKTVTSIGAVRISTEESFSITAGVFVDCTGDGGLAASAGASYFRGRESKELFDEPGALEKADTKSLGSTLLFMAKKHDKPMPFVAPSWARKFTEEDLKFRPHAGAGVDRGLEYGYWWLEWGGHLDTIKDNEAIRDELLAILMGVWDHVKNQPGHGAENWALDWFGSVPGKRESRRFAGQHVLTEQDVMESRPFADAIAYGGWPIDTHPPTGVDEPNEQPAVQRDVPRLYDIPLRCCVARDFTNLLFAGRNLSATHLAFASTRVMATCAAVGEGVGVAAAYAVANKLVPSDLPANPEHMRAIRQELLRQDAYVIGEVFDDPEDLARSAKLSVSSEHPDGPVANILSGQTRCVSGERGVEPGRSLPGTHRWMSDPLDPRPQWLQLDWDEPVSLSQISLVFDTGLHRHLTLSQSDAYARSMYWGSGQPETVKDFRIEGLDESGSWQVLSEVTGNYQRVRDLNLDRVRTVRALKITFLSNWGDLPMPTEKSFDGTESLPFPGGFRLMRLSVYPGPAH